MMAYRMERFISTLRNALAGIIISETDDPDLKGALITDLRISPDLRSAKIYISSITGDTEPLVQKLNRARGHIKRILPEKMALRFVPDLHFFKATGPDIEERIPNKPA